MAACPRVKNAHTWISKLWLLNHTSVWRTGFVTRSLSNASQISSQKTETSRKAALNHGQGTSTISAITEDVSSTHRKKMMPEPYFKIIANGVGSITHVQVPKGSYIYCRVGTVTGMSDTITNSQTMLGGFAASLQRKLAGGNMYVSKLSAETGFAGDVLLAPNGLGDVATLSMDGRTQYCVNKGNFLACSPYVRVGVQYLDSWSFKKFGAISLVASGSGTLAITSYGGLFRLILDEGERYQVSRRHLVAWDSRMSPTPLHESTVPEYENAILARASTVLRHGFNWVIEKPDMCVLEGPGDFYLASRLEPDFEVGRNAMRKLKQYIRVPGPTSGIHVDTPTSTTVMAAAAHTDLAEIAWKSTNCDSKNTPKVNSLDKMKGA